jgi:amino acid adenylation domain-containing protein
MWVIDRMTPGNPAYNVPVGYRIRGALNLTALENSINEIIKRHEVLRTTFVVKDGDPLQLIHSELTIKINVTQLDQLPGAERENRLHMLASEESVRSFDLSRLPLIRISVFKLGEAENVLIINMHHIVADGLSIGLMLDELDTFYRAYSRGEVPRPPDLVIQYADFAHWQRRTLADETAYTNQIEFWRKQLGVGHPVLELPSDMPRPTLQSFKGSNVFFNIPTSLAEDLRLLGAREGSTFFMTVLAAFQVLLHRYSGSEDMVIGTPVGARTPRELQPLIGNFLNMVALRCDLSGNPTFTELLRRTRETTLTAFSNSDLPFEAMLKHLTFQRDPSRNPIFQTILQVLPTKTPRIGDLEVSSFHFDLKFAQVDLSLLLYEDVGSYWGRLEYSTDLFKVQTVRRLCGHYCALLRAIVRDPDRSISTLPLLTDAERHQLLVEWNPTKREYPKSKCLHQLFEAQAEKTPDAVAVLYGKQQLTYRELNARANDLAHYLKRLGVGPDILVGLCAERSLELVIGILGILKAGGAYVPLDPTYPRERLEFMLTDSQVTVLLTQKHLISELPLRQASVVVLDSENFNADYETSCERTNTSSSVNPENLAYVIFTSGSTGKPKGVLVTHYNVVRLLQSTHQWFHFDQSDVWTLFHSYAFDFAVWEMWGALVYGGRLVVVPHSVTRSPREFSALIREHQVTVLNQTPSAFYQLLPNLLPTSVSEQLALRYIIFGGEALHFHNLQRWFDHYGDQRPQLINMYGITETTVHVTYRRITQKDLNLRTGSVIGKPIPDLRVYVLNAQQELQPVGIPGEIYIGGAGLARGYLHRHKLTAERFIADPFSDDPHAKLYRSGDIGRWLAHGELEYLGRIDDQVKIRGFRIELGEIEAMLNQHRLVHESVAVAREDMPGDKRLVAYIVPKREPSPAIHELRSFLKKKLPEYMVPSAYVSLNSLPLTFNGKVDRCALPNPGRFARQDYNEYVAPRDETERVLCRVWSEVLGVSRVGLDDDFFAIGGHSLLAAKLFGRLDEEFHRSLSLGVLFSAPTVRSLAEFYRTSVGSSGNCVLVPLTRGGSLPPLFAVPGVFGNVVGFEALARALGPDQPFYGLQSLGLDGKQAPLNSIGEMAKLYVKEARSVHSGPYAIIGACFGATVAYEMARQLLEEGEEVAFLGLLGPTDREGNADSESQTWLPRRCRRTLALGNLVTDRLNLYLKEMQEISIVDRIKYLAGKTVSLATSIGVQKGLGGAQRELNQIEVYRANLVALDCYHRKPLHGRLKVLEIFQPVLPDPDVQEPIDWNKLWKGFTKIHDVEAKDSGDMLSDQNVLALAALLKERLRAALSEG